MQNYLRCIQYDLLCSISLSFLFFFLPFFFLSFAFPPQVFNGSFAVEFAVKSGENFFQKYDRIYTLQCRIHNPQERYVENFNLFGSFIKSDKKSAAILHETFWLRCKKYSAVCTKAFYIHFISVLIKTF